MQARQMGYKSVTVIDVIVVADSTTTINFQLSSVIIKGKGVKLGSNKNIINKDLHQTAISSFAPAVAGFATVLRDSEFKGDSNIESILELAEGSKGKDAFGYRAEFLNMVKRAKFLLSDKTEGE